MMQMIKTFFYLVKRCAQLKSADDLQAFVELRELSWDMPTVQQANIIYDRLYKAVYKKEGSPLYTLCAIEMLLRHGNEVGKFTPVGKIFPTWLAISQNTNSTTFGKAHKSMSSFGICVTHYLGMV